MNDHPLEGLTVVGFMILVFVFILWGVAIAPLWIKEKGATIKKYKQILVENNLAAYNTVGEFYLLNKKMEKEQ